MAFDNSTRNKLARLVTDCRKLLTDEFTRQLQELYGIQPDGTMAELSQLSHLDDEGRAIAGMLRERVDHLVCGLGAEKHPEAVAVDRMTREQAFTLLNRFAGLRLGEERGLVQECVRQGLQSRGFQVYLKTAGTALGDTYQRYRHFIYCLFDEISVDLGVLFDRFSPYGLLFPRDPALVELLALLNNRDLQSIWTEDETIGWIYQYFNSKEERQAMRKASAAPRNSRELAVRNQFFTPRYVVEFLTDNTLGRTWYEMRKGDTRLSEACRYLVRRPNEIFLAPDAPVPEQPDNPDLSQEELLNQPYYVPHRPKKDPRTILMLDPAGGSGHFGLYCFDLYETIYHEAWDDPDLGPALQRDYRTRADFERDIPRLILKQNIHIIDIDPRAVQIAALALWLRAQRAWKEMGLKPQDRPAITQANIVCAEPMPGDGVLLREFTATLPNKVDGQIVEAIFEKMQLAGEAGSLLKIEEEITATIAAARAQWQREFERARDKKGQELLFSTGEMEQLSVDRQLTMPLFDVSGISDEEFWHTTEERIITALRFYAEQAENGNNLKRRLFAEDAARGFSFIDICRKRYDVLLMNPPYGFGSESSKAYLANAYPYTWIEIYIAFCERAIELCNKGFNGAITSRTFMYLKKFISFRIRIINNRLLLTLVDLGSGILDDAVVETVAWVFKSINNKFHYTTFFNLEKIEHKGTKLSSIIDNLLKGKIEPRLFIRNMDSFDDKDNSSISYTSELPSKNMLQAGGLFYQAKPGLGTRDDFRFARLRWEVPESTLRDRQWICAIYGSLNTKFYADNNMIINWIKNGIEMKTFIAAKYGSASRSIINEDFYFKPGLTYQYTGNTFRVHLLPKDCIITMAGQGLYPTNNSDLMALLGILNSNQATVTLKELNPGRFFQASYVNSIRINLNWKDKKAEFERLSQQAYYAQRNLCQMDETSPIFHHSLFCYKNQDSTEYVNSLIQKISKILIDIDEISSLYFNIPTISDSDKYIIKKISIYEHDISLLLGLLFGRWDFRITLVPAIEPKISDKFAPLPFCPPGMLVSPDGLPAKPNKIVSEEWLHARPDANSLPPERSVKNPTIHDEEYPIRVSWQGILVDDVFADSSHAHSEDIMRRVREVLEVLWQDRAETIEHEACEILGVKSLRDYFRKPTGFFQDHLKRYSKSRRQAPIYWPLSSANGNYTLWIYYHRLNDQFLYTCVNDYVNPRLRDLDQDLERLQKEYGQTQNARVLAQVESLGDFRQELLDFRDELLRVAKLPYQPNLNDGVLITAAPLWQLFRLPKWRKDLKACWDKLQAGDYDWAHLAYSIWPDRVRAKCQTDKSLAIAHDLESLYIEKPKNKKKG